MSNENSNEAPSPVNSPHSNVETPNHFTVNAPSPTTVSASFYPHHGSSKKIYEITSSGRNVHHASESSSVQSNSHFNTINRQQEHTTTTNVGNGPTYAPTDAMIFEGEVNRTHLHSFLHSKVFSCAFKPISLLTHLQTDVPIPGSNTSPPSSPSSNFQNPIPPLPTTQTTYPPTGDILFEGEVREDNSHTFCSNLLVCLMLAIENLSATTNNPTRRSRPQLL